MRGGPSRPARDHDTDNRNSSFVGKLAKKKSFLANGPPGRADFPFRGREIGEWSFFAGHFVSCVLVLDSGVKVTGSIPTGGILAQTCECVNALRVMHLNVRRHLISFRGDRTWADFPTYRTLNQQGNTCGRT